MIETEAVEQITLQWGRSFSERRTLRIGRGHLDSLASMGPLFFRAENYPPAEGTREMILYASMGPLFFRAENASEHGLNPRTLGFNGAALFQSGELNAVADAAVKRITLQWGRSFSERRTGQIEVIDATGRGLQWGRSFSERRTLLHFSGVWQGHPASMGPLFFRAENVSDQPPRPVPTGLQWGRSFSERRTFVDPFAPVQSLRASMGPLFFRAENTPQKEREPEPNGKLQWGRSFSERRTLPTCDGWQLLLASMGPLFFRAENVFALTCSASHRRFNGAALFQSGERPRRTRPVVSGHASMGPLFFRAENIHWRSSPRSHRRFNGAALFQSGEPGPTRQAPGCCVGFNGAALFQSGERDEEGMDPIPGEASMGPLFFRAENARSAAALMVASSSLQWGRSFSERRTLGHQSLGGVGVALQWCRSFSERRTRKEGRKEPTQESFNGAALFQSGERSSTISVPGTCRASMGPLFFRAENIGPVLGFSDSPSASMGPLFFRAENPPKRTTWAGGETLQWGRSFSERRTMSEWAARATPRPASMGPLFFRAENHVDCDGRTD